MQGLAFFAPTIVRSIYPNKSTIHQQLYTVPPYVVGAFFTVLIPAISYRMDRRQILIVLSAPAMMAGYAMYLASANSQVRYGATFLISSSSFALGPMTNAQVSANVVSDTARTSASGFNGTSTLIIQPITPANERVLVMMGNIGGPIATWSYLEWDGPDYRIGNGLNLATSGSILIIGFLALLWMMRDNRKREGRSFETELGNLSETQVQDLDWRHPGFRWAI